MSAGVKDSWVATNGVASVLGPSLKVVLAPKLTRPRMAGWCGVTTAADCGTAPAAGAPLPAGVYASGEAGEEKKDERDALGESVMTGNDSWTRARERPTNEHERPRWHPAGRLAPTGYWHSLASTRANRLQVQPRKQTAS